MRLCSEMSEATYEMVQPGVFGSVFAEDLAEMGCRTRSRKIRTRTNEGSVAKAVLATCEINPGMVIGIPCESAFVRVITRPEYSTKMKQLTVETEISGVKVKLMTRKYICEGQDHVRI